MARRKEQRKNQLFVLKKCTNCRATAAARTAETCCKVCGEPTLVDAKKSNT